MYFTEVLRYKVLAESCQDLREAVAEARKLA